MSKLSKKERARKLRVRVKRAAELRKLRVFARLARKKIPCHKCGGKFCFRAGNDEYMLCKCGQLLWYDEIYDDQLK